MPDIRQLGPQDYEYGIEIASSFSWPASPPPSRPSSIMSVFDRSTLRPYTPWKASQAFGRRQPWLRQISEPPLDPTAQREIGTPGHSFSPGGRNTLYSHDYGWGDATTPRISCSHTDDRGPVALQVSVNQERARIQLPYQSPREPNVQRRPIPASPTPCLPAPNDEP